VDKQERRIDVKKKRTNNGGNHENKGVIVF
jgi:hypothetical protein